MATLGSIEDPVVTIERKSSLDYGELFNKEELKKRPISSL
jgi:hypothetical protein